jgi:hypothetical protein
MSLLLLDALNDDSLRHVVDYLDGAALSRLECVCQGTKQIAESYGWEIVAKRDLKSPRQLKSSRPSTLSPKHRVVRWTLTSRYAAKIESRRKEQWERGETFPGPDLSQGVNAWDCDTFEDPGHGHRRLSGVNCDSKVPDLRQHDFFLRLSDGEKCIWEGFAPLVVKPCSNHWGRHNPQQHDFDLGIKFNEEGFDWYKGVMEIFESHPAFQDYQKFLSLWGFIYMTGEEHRFMWDLHDLS